jgi:hypothetical protein
MFSALIWESGGFAGGAVSISMPKMANQSLVFSFLSVTSLTVASSGSGQ